jgi:formylglycine-generating enzyme required for sulfatase activity
VRFRSGTNQPVSVLNHQDCNHLKLSIRLSKQLRILFTWLCVFFGLVIHLPLLLAQNCPSEQGLSASPSSVVDAVNPNPSPTDFSLPMPCKGQMILRHVCVPAEGYFADLPFDMGCKDCGRIKNSFMEGKRLSAVSGPFTLQDLPAAWRMKLENASLNGDGRCPQPGDTDISAFYYFIGKYEVTNFQWKAVMNDVCSGTDSSFVADDARPKTGITWFEAVEFARKYTEWLIKNAPEYLPKFSNDRFGYLRLPTEAEWEYAARGGHMVTESQLNDAEFFPLNNRPYKDFAVFTERDAAKPQQKLAWIGSKCANPLGLFDTAGNAAEMVLDPFHFSIGSRLHGAAGGFIIKGGSFRKSLVEIMPGRREEQPFFLGDGAFRSSDIGFRLVLSGILTPQNRKERLDQEWADLSVQQNSGQASTKFSASKIEIDQSKDPIAEIERLVAMSADETEKKNLLFLREVLKQKSILLKEQEAETLKGIIHSALFTVESLEKYAIRRKIVLDELNKLEKMKDQTVSQASLDSLESKIAKEKETIRLLDSATDHFVKFYLNRIRKTQRYPEEFFASQISVISQELGLEQVFSRSLRKRMDLFRSHVALYRRKAGNVSQQEIQSDLIGP